MRYSYPAEKFYTARRILMLPHPKGESHDIAGAYHECQLALRDIKPDDLDNDARGWRATLERLMDTTGIQESPRGTAAVKADQLTDDQKQEFSDAVDSLAYWFDRKSR